MSIDSTLEQLRLSLPPVAAPVAAYVPATRSGRLVYTSGQLPFADGALAETGRLGAELSVECGSCLAGSAH
jgi:enamine deaminase RidA (YjgF/YER057c/UK114 family)